MSNVDNSGRSDELLSVVEVYEITVKESSYLASIDVFVGDAPYNSKWLKNGNELKASFQPPLALSGKSTLTLRIHYRPKFRGISMGQKPAKDVILDQKSLLPEATAMEVRESRQRYGKTEVIVKYKPMTTLNPVESNSTGSDALLPTTENILSICPRFRILVIGKTGVGKSSLINSVFGTPIAEVSDTRVVKADIDQEITWGENQHLVIHDSCGFEPGEVDTVKLAREFILRRRQEQQLKDKLHAVWLCLEIPTAGGRVMETAVEDFIKRKISEELGSVPMIVVFTKYDKLIERVAFEMRKQNDMKEMLLEQLVEHARPEAERRLKEICIDPFERSCGGAISHITVSTASEHRDAIENLTKLTYSLVGQYVASEPSIVAAMAQQSSPAVSIDASIEVGKLKYWKGLASGTILLGKTLKDTLEVIHTDIVLVWNFQDPRKHYLQSPDFQKFMYDLLDDDAESKRPALSLTVGVSIVGTMAGIITALAGPVAPIVLPIAASAVLGVWLYEVYQQSHPTLRRLMTYIVDLTLAMQNIYYLAVIGERRITRRLIKFALKAYKDSPVKDDVHTEINQYVRRAGIFERAGRDGVVDKIGELLHKYCFESPEMRSLKDAVANIDLTGDDEPWEV